MGWWYHDTSFVEPEAASVAAATAIFDAESTSESESRAAGGARIESSEGYFGESCFGGWEAVLWGFPFVSTDAANATTSTTGTAPGCAWGKEV